MSQKNKKSQKANDKQEKSIKPRIKYTELIMFTPTDQ